VLARGATPRTPACGWRWHGSEPSATIACQPLGPAFGRPSRLALAGRRGRHKGYVSLGSDGGDGWRSKTSNGLVVVGWSDVTGTCSAVVWY
jgi:hypothetical protein